MQHRNIPIFIPHLGCPNQCVFCNQHSISGRQDFDPQSVRGEVERALATIPEDTETEIAFFGGSFTGIDRDLMIRLLDIADSFVKDGRVQSIRLSTRPDYISNRILEILSQYPVRHIELGLQSMQDSVLSASHRGHTAEQARQACRSVLNAGFSLVGQMMIGLPGSTLEDECQTAREICDLGASAVRIYPTVVFYDTPLCQLAQEGEYTPLSTLEAVERSAKVLRIFRERDIPCIRIGLCASEDLISPEHVYAGPNHPALGELVWNAYYYDELKQVLQEKHLLGKSVCLTIPKAEYSKIVGQKRSNVERIQLQTGTVIQKIIADNKRIGILAEEYRA